MSYKVLIMGLPMSGKTTLAEQLVNELSNHKVIQWVNADRVREIMNDWDFTVTGRLRQANRIAYLADNSNAEIVVCDFIAPHPKMREAVNANYTIWMDTITESIYADTNKMFIPPVKPDLIIKKFIIDVEPIAKTILSLYT